LKRDPFAFEREVLDNGTEIFYQRGGFETEIRLVSKAGGSRYDPIGKEGCAHLLEHLMAKRTSYFTDEKLMNEFILEHDLRMTAWTDLESIVIGGNSTKSEWKPLFFLLEEILKWSKLIEELLEKEKEIVISEMLPHYRMKEWIDVELETKRILYRNHPFSRIIRPSGTPSSVRSLSVEDLTAHRKRFFVASNLSVVIITNFRFEKAKKEVQKHFSLREGKVKYPRSPKNFPKPSKNLVEYSISEILKIEKRPEIGETAEFFWVVPTTRLLGTGPILSTLKEILMRSLRYETGLIYNVDVSVREGKDISEIKIVIPGIPVNKSQEVVKITQKEISGFSKQRNIFEMIRRNRLRRLHSYQKLPSVIADEVAKDIQIYNKPITIQERIENIERFDFRQACDWVENWLNEERVLVRIFTP
jgi:predicted Zn-dependent peptidase